MHRGATASIFRIVEVLVDCRQGCQESQCIFNYYFDYVLKVATYETDKKFPDGWGIPHFSTNRKQGKSGRVNDVQ